MEIIHFDRKSGEMKIRIDTLEDLWHLEKVIDARDVVESSTTRTYKVGKKEEKKKVRIAIKVERVEYSKSSNKLRILGKIIAGSPEEFVQLGRHHTIEVGIDTKIKITKEWKDYQIKRINEAVKESKKPKIRIIVMDDEKAIVASLKPYGVEISHEIRSGLSKKSDDYSEKKQSYFGQIAAEINNHPEKYIVAGPGFEKDDFKKFLADHHPELLKKIHFESCSYAERSGINELIKKGVVEKIAGEERYQEELNAVEKLIEHISKDDGYATYGINQVEQAAEIGAIDKLLVLDEYLRTEQRVEKIVETAEKNGADILIISSEGDAGIKLKSFGKIGAILRFRISSESF